MTSASIPRGLLLLLAMLTLVCSGDGFADAPRDQRKFTDAAKQEGTRRRAAIVEETRSLADHRWAGEYYVGDGLGVNVSLSLAPANGFVFTWHGCLGLYDQNWGEVSEDEAGVIHLKCAFDNNREGFQGIATEMLLVPWGERRYLVPVDEMVAFCNHVNTGSADREGRHTLFAMRRGDERKRIDGAPDVPERYRRFLLAKPITATIVEVDGAEFTVDVGARDGAFVGMQMFITDDEYVVRSINLTAVDDRSSIAHEASCFSNQPELRSGLGLSTRAPWNR
jgi:hypothetical protein